MKNHRTHKHLTKGLFPFLNEDTIDRVNEALDNPTMVDKAFSNMTDQMFGGAPTMPGMWKSGHRKYNHDMFTAMWKGFQVGGTDGILVAMNHLMQDTISDQMVGILGMDGRDMFESAYLMTFGRKK